MKGLAHAALIAAVCTTTLLACSETSTVASGSVDRTVRVVVEPLQLSSVETRADAVGTSRAVQSIAIHPATSGEVTSIRFEPGQQVEAGDVLVELDQRDEKLAVELAEVRLQDARRLYERYQLAGDTGAVLPTILDAARTTVESARIELDRARIALDYRTVVAPFSGYVGITDVDRGDRVNPETIITTLDDRSALLVSFELPEVLIQDLAVGSPVSVAPWHSRELPTSGVIVDIGSRIDPASRSFTARAWVENEDDRLRPGMSFNVEVNLEGTPLPVIAETAVQWGADGAYVWTIDDSRARRIPVEVIQRRQGRILVESELQEGDLIVIEGVQRVREGIEVSYHSASFVEMRHPTVPVTYE